ncbi:aminomethyltransferase beta-barrel domain-containing protein [Halobacteriovorax sp. HLS]|uniref:aminomethyltransferase beta-barrel domain-containing protein n=1 Tax=Halobacteriovorax sp. HLS TaxID=2234000 RepID=UPI000FDC345C|nr:aminomethyltransferase beta-barrel domain-containing protein [Halobacteriovorax sp. HLS]
MNKVDRNTREIVVVGMDGGLESTVAAYLLKKQGLNVIGLGVIFHEYDYPCFKTWNPADLDKVKLICDQLEIPFYGTNVSSLFYARVIEPVVSTKLAGESFEAIIAWNKVLLETLISKAKQLKATMVSTGHMAKVFKNQKSGVYSLLVPNDVANDETYGLSRLSQAELSMLVFPLAEIKSTEVEKIAGLLGIKFLKDNKASKEIRKSFFYDPEFVDIVERFSPPSLRKEGILINYNDETTVGEHDGVHLYHLNQSELHVRGTSQLDKNLHVIKIYPGKQLVYVDYIDRHYYTHCRLMRFSHDPSMDLSRPMKCYVQTEPNGEKLPCTLYFKNNRTVVVEFEKERTGQCPRGGYQVFYNKRGIGGKVIGSGVVRHAGFFDDGEFRTLPKSKIEEELTGEKEERKVVEFEL